MTNKSTNANVKISILDALGRIEDPSSVPLAIEIMKSGEIPQVTIAGLEALGRIEETSALPAISEYLTSNVDAIKSAALKAYARIN